MPAVGQLQLVRRVLCRQPSYQVVPALAAGSRAAEPDRLLLPIDRRIGMGHYRLSIIRP